jgi:hypothetical protein
MSYRAILSNSAGEIDRIESASREFLQAEVAQRLFGEWQLMPGDTIKIEEVQL